MSSRHFVAVAAAFLVAACSSAPPPSVDAQGDAGDRHERGARGHQEAVVRRVRRPRARHRRAKTLTVQYLTRPVQGGRRSSPAIRTARGRRRCRSSASRRTIQSPLVVQEGRPDADVQAARRRRRVQPARDRRRSTLENSEIVFVGYGVQAPEFKWDDFKGIDVKGKTIVVLVNDPPVPRSERPSDARSEDVRRQGDDVLRPLDLQVREGRRARRRRRASSSTRPNPPAIRSTSCRASAASASIS